MHCGERHIPELLKRPRGPLPAWRRALYITGAVVALALGVAGGLLPLAPGVLFYFIALALLTLASNRVREWVNRLDARLSEKWRLRVRRGLRRVHLDRFRGVFNLGERGGGDRSASHGPAGRCGCDSLPRERPD